MTPILAIIVGPPRLQSSRTSIAVCHSGRSDSFFGRLVMYVAASRNVTSFSPARRRYRIFELASPALFALCHLLALGHPIRGGWAEQGVRQIRSYLIRCTSIASQAFSASANVLKGDPPTLMAVLLKLMGRQEATKPGCPWSPGPLLLSLLITNE